MSAEILVLGAGGQLGKALVGLLGERAMAFGRHELNLASSDFRSRFREVITTQPLSAVINAAAYTQVDEAQGEGKSAAFQVNAQAVTDMAYECAAQQLPLVHYSTDYVFDGSGAAPWKESDPAAPINNYGMSKRSGEQGVETLGGQYLIFRTSWVYDAWGKNFFTTILRLLNEKDSIRMASDQIGAPTYAPHLARATLEALERALGMACFPSGLYHLCNGGETSRYDFAQAIFALARTADSRQGSAIRCQRIDPIPTADYPLPAPRPLNSRLDCAHAREVLGVALPHWEAGLQECFTERYAGSRLPDSGSEDRSAGRAGG